MPERPLGIAFIGLHHQHPRWYWPLWAHLPQYRPVAVCDPDEPFLRVENELFKLDALTDPQRVLERDDVDVVVLWTPHDQMPGLVEQAAAAGKHVIVEKPCAADVAGARRIVEAARRYPGVKISTPFCWRTHRGTAVLRDAIAHNHLGRITAMEARLNAGGAGRYVRDNSPWMLSAAQGGGPMWNLGVHWIDCLQWLTGQRIVSVSGAVSGPVGDPPRDIEDNAQALCTFADGAVAILDISYGLTESYPGKRDIFVGLRGTHGSARWAPAWQGCDDDILLVSETSAADIPRSRTVRVTSRDLPGYCGEMAWTWLADFAQAVREDRSPLVSPADILAAVQVADAFYRSVTSGRRTATGLG
jgi:predicted dehydrogenase